MEHLSKKLSSSIYGIRMVRRSVSTEAAIQAYYASFHGLATHGVQVWGVSPALETIFRQQKRAIRIIAGVPSMETCRPLFKRYGILTLPSVFILTCLLWIHGNRHGVVTHADVHSHDTRNKHSMVMPYSRVKRSQQSTHYAIKMFNRLPENLKKEGQRTFKKTVKSILREQAFYSVEEYLSHNLSHNGGFGHILVANCSILNVTLLTRGRVVKQLVFTNTSIA